MKVSVLQENLSRALGVVGRAVAAKSPLPMTSNILLQTDNGRLKLAATNLEIGINCWIGAKVEEDGAIAVPAKLLTEFVNSMPNDRIDLAVSARTRALHLRCARFDARMNGQDAEDFPLIPVVGDKPTARIDPQVLKEAIGQVVFAAAVDDTRPVLTGVYLKLTGNDITLAAADGFRLAVKTATLEGSADEALDFVVPARTMAELARVLGDTDDPVELTVTANRSQVLFHVDSVDMVSQLIPGNFPNFPQLIPQSFASRAVLNTQEFRQATEAAAIFSRDNNGIIRLQLSAGEELTPGKLLVTGRADEVGENLGEMDAVVEGAASKIALNAKYLAEVLKAIPAQQVLLQTNSHSNPGVLRPVGDDSYTHVIMPMFVQW